MADFPIWKQIDINGKPVPFVYPQHKTKEGYEETGYDNPLPTGSHVMTEGGIWIPQRGSDDGAAHTQVTGSNVEFRELIIKNDETIQAGAREYADVYSNPGEIWTIVRFGFEVQRTLGSEGTHEIALFHGTGASDANWIAQFSQNSTSYLRGVVPGRFTQYRESDPEVGLNLTESIKNTTILSDDLPFRIRVRNLSDIDMTGARTFRLFYKVEKVAS